MNIKQELRSAFDRQLSMHASDLERRGAIWVGRLDEQMTFAVMFEFSDPNFIPNTVAIYCGLYPNNIRPTQDMTGVKWEYIKFPYSVHHQLFEISKDAMWSKEKVGYFYWLLLMQQKKMHVNNQKQVDYCIDKLLPYAAKEAERIYKKYKKIYPN